jgi:4-hydroxybenzoate polyprenyltransferase
MTPKNSISNYLSLIKFSHTVFALPFAMIGYLLGLMLPNTVFEWNTFAVILLCMVFARSAAMAFNRYIDRNIDKVNPRTAIREIPAGIITPRNALVFIVINSLLFVAATFFLNPLCFYLSPVALTVILGYSYTKRFTSFSHVVLGMGLALAPIGAYLAVTGSFAVLPLFFSCAVLFWVSGFDIIYALQDVDFDRSQKLRSLPVVLGTKNALRLSSYFHVATTACLIAAGIFGSFGILYWAGCMLFSGLLIYQHTLVKHDDLSKVNLAFFTANGLGSIVLSIFVILDLLIA